jgi:hypothetical protein
MKEADAQKVLDAMKKMFTMPEQYINQFRDKLLELELSGNSEPKIDWITEARDVALNLAEERGRVSIVDVLHECPLPIGIDPRVVGGVFKHQAFVRIDSITIKTDNGRYKTVGVFGLHKNA